MRIGIICNGSTLSVWQRRAIEQLDGRHEIFLLIARADHASGRMWNRPFYYALNLVSIRNRLTRAVPFPDDVAISDSIAFDCAFEGAWAVLPDPVLDWVLDRGIEVILKFGLSLLRIPPETRLAAPILSYHHGDPRKYRGRPAGFYEILNGERFVGQIVQILNNKLDAGAVVAFAETRVSRHSYRKTLVDAYSLSPYLLAGALEAVRRRQILPFVPSGRNYRLPDNLTVLRFLLVNFRSLVRLLGYGAFVEKRWNVATAVLAPADPLCLVAEAERRKAEWRSPGLLPSFSFYADGFFHSGPDDMLVEAMNHRSGKGELVRIRGDRQDRISHEGGHLSYPMTVEEDGRLYVVPEIAGWSRPAIFAVEGNALRPIAELDIGETALLDPTLFRHGGRLFLFANRCEDGASVLHLWSSQSLFSCFERHPASPIRVSARGSRMAGEIMPFAAGLYRIGQDSQSGYGDGIQAFRIEMLSENDYHEEEMGAAAFESVRGPHTLNIRSSTILFDWYVDRWSLFAGPRRIMNRL